MTKVSFKDRLSGIVQELERKGVSIPKTAKKSGISANTIPGILKDDYREFILEQLKN